MPQLSSSLSEALNKQIQIELESAYLYLAMSNACAVQPLKGAAHWLRLQWEEETGHATKLIDYVLSRGNQVHLMALERPEFAFKSFGDLFRRVLEHEQGVTRSINDLVALAEAEKDYAAQAFLQWYVLEQVEEENSAQEILDTLKIAGDQGPTLLILDRQLAGRQAEPR